MRYFQYLLGVFPSSFSQPGWGPATAELRTTIGDFEQSTKNRAQTLSPNKTKPKLNKAKQKYAYNGNIINGNCNGCSPIKVKENFTPPRSFQRSQICPDIVFLQLTFVNCIIRCTLECCCIT